MSQSDIWVVNRADIRGLDPEEKQILNRLDNKDYRNTKGYGYLEEKMASLRAKNV